MVTDVRVNSSGAEPGENNLLELVRGVNPESTVGLAMLRLAKKLVDETQASYEKAKTANVKDYMIDTIAQANGFASLAKANINKEQKEHAFMFLCYVNLKANALRFILNLAFYESSFFADTNHSNPRDTGYFGINKDAYAGIFEKYSIRPMQDLYYRETLRAFRNLFLESPERDILVRTIAARTSQPVDAADLNIQLTQVVASVAHRLDVLYKSDALSKCSEQLSKEADYLGWLLLNSWTDMWCLKNYPSKIMSDNRDALTTNKQKWLKSLADEQGLNTLGTIKFKPFWRDFREVKAYVNQES